MPPPPAPLRDFNLQYGEKFRLTEPFGAGLCTARQYKHEKPLLGGIACVMECITQWQPASGFYHACAVAARNNIVSHCP